MIIWKITYLEVSNEKVEDNEKPNTDMNRYFLPNNQGISILIFRFNWKINIVCKQMQRNDITKYLEKWIRMQRFPQLNDVSSSF